MASSWSRSAALVGSINCRLGLLPCAGPPARRPSDHARQFVREDLPALPARRIAVLDSSLEMRNAAAGRLPTEPTWTGSAIVLGSESDGRRPDRPTASRRACKSIHWRPTATSLGGRQLEQICPAGPAPHLFITTGRDAPPIDFDHGELWDYATAEPCRCRCWSARSWMQLPAPGKWLDRARWCHHGRGGRFRFRSRRRSGPGRGSGRTAESDLCRIRDHAEPARPADQSGRCRRPTPSPANSRRNIFRRAGFGQPRLRSGLCRTAGGCVTAAPAIAAGPPGNSGVRPRRTWVVTGGARGITAACALEAGPNATA